MVAAPMEGITVHPGFMGTGERLSEYARMGMYKLNRLSRPVSVSPAGPSPARQGLAPLARSVSARPAGWGRAPVVRLAACLAGLAGLACSGVGCGGPHSPSQAGVAIRPESLASQQMRAYPEAAGGMFVPLVDFEAAAGQASGADQVGLFSIRPPGRDASCKFAVNITRTGAGAMAVTLPMDSSLTLSLPGYDDFSGYTLLSLAVHSDSLRDDLTVTIADDRGRWRSGRTLIGPGWNNVEIDLQRLAADGSIDIEAVRSISLAFADAVGPVSFYLDDIMLIDNERDITPVPAGMTLHKRGLDYRLTLPGGQGPVMLKQFPDGLWRLTGRGATVQLAAGGQPLPPSGEQIGLMGSRRTGRVELIEHNSVRVRFVNTWYFPDRPGEWLSLAVRRIRWQYTIYADGRWITHIELNNAGGPKIGSLRLWLDRAGAWSPGVVSRDLVIRDFHRPVGRWSYLLPPDGLRAKTMCSNYIRPGRIEPILAAGTGPAGGGGSGFDPAQGCYLVGAKAGHCRFIVYPPAEGLLEPTFLVAGPWPGPVSVNVQGLAVRNVAKLADGAVLFTIPGWIRRPVTVEVAGASSRLDEQTGKQLHAKI